MKNLIFNLAFVAAIAAVCFCIPAFLPSWVKDGIELIILIVVVAEIGVALKEGEGDGE